MKLTSSFRHLIPGLIGLAAALPAHASFLTGFETSSGYGTNTTVIGVQDSAAPSGNLWTGMFAASSYPGTLTSSTAHPQTGTQALQISALASEGAARGVRLDLGSSVDLTNPFSLQFALSIDSLGTPSSGYQAQVTFGSSGTNFGTDPFWFRVSFSNDTIRADINNISGLGVHEINLGTWSAYADIGNGVNLGGYLTFSIEIDPTTFAYTKFQVSGDNGSADFLPAIVADNGGITPHLSGTPGAFLQFFTGSNDSVTFNVDNISVVPEPATAVLAAASFGLLALRRRSAWRGARA